jgi:protein gp37
MGATTRISWSQATWNAVIGCSHVSPGCASCYAETLALRYGWSKHPWGAQWAKENVQLKPHKLDLPLRWSEPRRIFVNSMSDVFHEEIPDDYIDKMFAIMAVANKHIYQILTKRCERMRQYLTAIMKDTDRILRAWRQLIQENPFVDRFTHKALFFGQAFQKWGWPWKHVWIGVSVEDQRRADERIPILLDTPAYIRFLSCEPLLGEISLNKFLWYERPPLSDEYGSTIMPIDKLHWVIVGGESGPNYRPMDLDWAQRLCGECVDADVAFFYKQSAGSRPGMNDTLYGRTWQEFPDESFA